jgi:hypothetical protein
MRATGLMPSSEAISLVQQSVKTATPQGVKDQAAPQEAMRASLVSAQDLSASSRLVRPDREVRLGLQETTKESLFR